MQVRRVPGDHLGEEAHKAKDGNLQARAQGHGQVQGFPAITYVQRRREDGGGQAMTTRTLTKGDENQTKRNVFWLTLANTKM